MEETQNLFETPPAAADPDKTLATPRFDEVEAQVARPVVPLAEMPARRRRSQWPVALVLVSALAGGAISILAFRLYQQRQQQPQAAATETISQPEATTDAPQTPAPEPNQPLTATAAASDTPQAETPVVIETYEREEKSAEKRDDKAAPKAAEEDARPAREAARKEDRKEERKVEEARGEPVAARARRVEERPAPRRVEVLTDDDRSMRHGERGDDDFYEQMRERRRQRREERREQRRGGRERNIDRIKDIFQGPPPA